VSTSTSETRVALWRFHARQGYWGVSARPYARALSSVVLDAEVKQVLLDDLNWFLKDETYAFYGEHGIPYHRSYLLHGPPGTGKTSTIFALAGKFRRNVCFIQMDPAVTDEAFRTAMATVPAESVVVLEDIDALFNVHREKSETSALSFSGFLNALDGLGAPEDVVFMMTTNHPDRLDPAVLRPGRVDVKCEFKTMSREMAAEYFLTFYEDAGCAQRFADQVVNMLSSQQVTMAQLQSFFLACHRNGHDAEAAVKELKKYPFEATRRQPMETMY
jgi:chaperone BCS1